MKYILFILIPLISLSYTPNLYSQTYKVDKKDSSSQDLAYYCVTDNVFNYRVYFDPINENAASESIPYLYGLYKEILKFNKVKDDLVKWADVLFVSDKKYKSLAQGNTRWVIQNQDSAGLSHQAKSKIYSLIGHEQVHALQKQFKNCKNLPRWFEEGQAVWTEDKVLSYLIPNEWNERFKNLQEIYKSKSLNKKTVPLEDWGGMAFNIEAIKRQLTPEGVKYLEKHGTTPPGVTLSFAPKDFKEEEHDILYHAVNYYKSFMIFKEIEDTVGIVKLIAWNKTVINKCYTTNQIINSLKEEYNLDISKKLKQ